MSRRLQTDARVSGGKCRTLESRERNRMRGKIMKIGETMSVQPDDLIRKRVCFSGGARGSGVSRLLEIVDEAEEVIPG